MALPIEADEAGEIFGMLENAVDAVIRVAKTFGLQVNFPPGKTEAVLGLHGRGLAAARQQLADLEVETEGGRIPVLPVYVDSPMATDATKLYEQFHRAHRLGFFVLADLENVSAHAHENAEHAGAGAVEAHVFYEQVRPRLRGLLSRFMPMIVAALLFS